jgi:hypothetical protein
MASVARLEKSYSGEPEKVDKTPIGNVALGQTVRPAADSEHKSSIVHYLHWQQNNVLNVSIRSS